MNFLGSVGGWDEKFLQQESELKRVRSEKANLEQHILGMESELETLQEERTKLQDETETQRRRCSGMEQQIETLTTEVSRAANQNKSTHLNQNFTLFNVQISPSFK